MRTTYPHHERASSRLQRSAFVLLLSATTGCFSSGRRTLKAAGTVTIAS